MTPTHEAIEQARREERERCVRICEEYAKSLPAVSIAVKNAANAARELARRIGGGE